MQNGEIVNYWLGRKRSEENKRKISESLKLAYKEHRRDNYNHWLGKKYSEESKRKISEAMKLAHKEHRAHNIGQSRWNNEPSYPEKFFMNVIKNEFEDQNYVREYPFKIYSLDFAWPEKKQCIEIDGEQHYRFQEYIERDIRKNKVLTENNWEFLRIPWKDMFSNTKDWIHVAKTFIDNVSTYILNIIMYVSHQLEIAGAMV